MGLITCIEDILTGEGQVEFENKDRYEGEIKSGLFNTKEGSVGHFTYGNDIDLIEYRG